MPPLRHRTHGFTLLEMAAVLAILAIVVSAATPSYINFMQRQQLRSAGDALQQDLRNAREFSVRTRRPVFISYSLGKTWCWGVSAGQPCDCSGASPLPACNISQARSIDFKDVRLDRAEGAEFDPTLGQAVRNGSVAFSTLNGHSLRVELNGMGRAHQCGPDAVGAPPC